MQFSDITKSEESPQTNSFVVIEFEEIIAQNIFQFQKTNIPNRRLNWKSIQWLIGNIDDYEDVSYTDVVNEKVNSEFGVEKILDSKGNKIADIPEIFPELIYRVKKSLYILELEEDWDSEDGKPISIEIFKKSVNFLIRLVTDIFKKEGIVIDIPYIEAGRNGNINLFWNKKDYKLLIRFFENSINNKDGEFYGERDSAKFEDVFSIENDYNKNNGAFFCFLTKVLVKQISR